MHLPGSVGLGSALAVSAFRRVMFFPGSGCNKGWAAGVGWTSPVEAEYVPVPQVTEVIETIVFICRAATKFLVNI